MKLAQILRLTALILTSSTWLAAADFVAPAEGPVPFRRDQIPLEVTKIAELSNQLESLVLGLDPDLIEHRRAAAQMLALATALDPANTSARQLIVDYQLGNPPPSPQAEEIPNAQTMIRQTKAWLESPEAGPSANALAHCLADVLAVSDPRHPAAAASPAAAERGQWAKWVPSLAAYERKEIAPAETQETSVPYSSTPIALPSAEVRSVLWTLPVLGNSERENVPSLISAELKVGATPAEASLTGLGIRCEPASAGVTLGPAKIFQTLLQNQNPDTPLALQFTFSSPAFAEIIDRASPRLQFPRLQPGTVNAAAATLAHAAITGQMLDATIIGLLNEQGEFIPGEDFWDQLVALFQNPANGKRLVVPAAAEPFLLAVLALENSEFFFDYELVSASDFAELLARSTTPLAGHEAVASLKFQEIRGKSPDQATARYVSNPFVRRRLAELAAEAPHHLSAKMLGIQGSGQRPIQVHRQVLVSMLRKALAPIGRYIKQHGHDYLASDSLLLRYPEPFREALATIQPYVTKSDLPLFTAAQEILAALRTLERASRAANRNYYEQTQLEAALGNLIKIYQLHAPELGFQSSNSNAVPSGK